MTTNRLPAAVSAAALLAIAACAPQGPSVPASSLASPAPQRTAILRTAPAPQTLVGVPPATVEQHLGQPAFDGREGAARIWRYSGKGCALIVVFYAEPDGSVRSAHLDARRLEGGSADINACLRDVVNTPQA